MNEPVGLGKIDTKLDFTIIICTKNRPAQIESVVIQIKQQICPELKSLVVVDGSDSEETESKIRSLQNSWPAGREFEYFRTRGGKPTALNLSLDRVASGSEKPYALLFFDDDIHFNLQDFVRGMAFLRDHNFCGLSPLIINEGESSSIKSEFCAKSILRNQQGVITKAGENVWVSANYLGKEAWIPTSWLPGGAAMYRYQKISDLRFSQNLENPILGGYALGDDVDFAIRASHRGQIGCLRSIQVIHSPTQDSRRQPLKIARAEGKWKAHLVDKFPEKTNLASVIFIQFIKTAWRFFRRDRSREPFLELWNFLIGFFMSSSNSKSPVTRSLHKTLRFFETED